MPRSPATHTPDADTVREAVEAAGGLRPLADALGITYQSIQEWIARGQVPAVRVLELERITGVSRYRLRPDIYGQPRGRRAA